MCDCYGHKCGKCGREWPIHLEDFATDREEIAVWCFKHYKRNIETNNPAMVFNLIDEDYKGKIVIEYLTDNAVNHKDGNVPNCDYEIIQGYISYLNGLPRRKHE